MIYLRLIIALTISSSGGTSISKELSVSMQVSSERHQSRKALHFPFWRDRHSVFDAADIMKKGRINSFAEPPDVLEIKRFLPYLVWLRDQGLDDFSRKAAA